MIKSQVDGICRNAIFLDFDGVLIDTVREAFCVAYLTCHEGVAMSGIDYGGELYDSFRRYRYLIGTAWHYAALMKVLESQPEKAMKTVEERFRALTATGAMDEYLRFEQRFFEVRSYLVHHHFDDWVTLNEPFPFLVLLRDIINHRNHRGHNIFIITTKNRLPVETLLMRHTVEIPAENLYCNDSFKKYGSKRAILEMLMGRNRFQKALFIDDLPEHLYDCEGISGLRLAHAAWGYGKNNNLSHDAGEMAQMINEMIGNRHVWG